MTTLAVVWAGGFVAAWLVYGYKRLNGAERVPWPILLTALALWPVTVVLGIVAWRSGREP